MTGSQDVQGVGQTTSSPRNQFVSRFNKVRLGKATGPVGPAELVALGVSALLLLVVVVAYLYLVLPARLRLHAVESDRVAMDAKVKKLQVIVGDESKVGQRVAAIDASISEFERTALGSRSTGRTTFYSQLNELMRKHSLLNTAGPTYATLDALDPVTLASSKVKAGSARFQSLYPGIEASVTVEGQYANVRQFVHDIEALNQFVVVNTIELQDASANQPAANADLAGGAGPELNDKPQGRVSLRVDMTVYFQRDSAGPGAVPEGTPAR